MGAKMYRRMRCIAKWNFFRWGTVPNLVDAIVVRCGYPSLYELMVIDGGNLGSGKLLLEHIRAQFGKDARISQVLLTHSDADHASGLRDATKKEYEVISEIVDLGIDQKCKIYYPFQRDTIGPFGILSPSRYAYLHLLAQFYKTPDPDHELIESVSMWLGKQPSALGKLLEKSRRQSREVGARELELCTAEGRGSN